MRNIGSFEEVMIFLLFGINRRGNQEDGGDSDSMVVEVAGDGGVGRVVEGRETWW